MAGFTHTPAHSHCVPDTFEIDGVEVIYEVRQDLDAEDPRTWIEDAHAAVYTYSGPHGHRDEIPDNPVAEAFAHFYKIFDDQKALAATKRWLALFHPEIEKAVDLEIATVRGYSQSDWRDVFAVVSEGYGTAADHIDEFRMWAFGDVWTVEAIPGDSLSGIYADDAEEAFEQFLADNPPPLDALVFDEPESIVAALFKALVDRGSEQAARSLHAHRDQAFETLSLGKLLDVIEEISAKEAEELANENAGPGTPTESTDPAGEHHG